MEEDVSIGLHRKARSRHGKERERMISWGCTADPKFEVVKQKEPLYQRD